MECGAIIGCHYCNKSVREMTLYYYHLQLIMGNLGGKWKSLGTKATQPQSYRTGSLIAEANKAELQSSSGINIST